MSRDEILCERKFVPILTLVTIYFMFSPNYINTKNTMKILVISLTKAQSVHYDNIFEQMTMPNFT